MSRLDQVRRRYRRHAVKAARQKYVAVFGQRDGRIISVYASSEREAKREVVRQLSKPGREAILKRWQEDGERFLASEKSSPGGGKG